MPTLTLTYNLDSDDGLLAFRSPSVPFTLLYTQKVDDILTVAAGTTKTLWDATDTAPLVPTTFLALILRAENGAGLEIELTAKQGDADSRQFLVTLEEGWPFLLGLDDSRYNFTVGAAGDAFAGTAGTINKVRVKNTSTDDVRLRRILLA
jgi:hypothetical protein